MPSLWKGASLHDLPVGIRRGRVDLCHRPVDVGRIEAHPGPYDQYAGGGGSRLDGFGLYEPLIDFAGAGATVPITSFGNALVHGAMAEAEQHGLVGVITGIFEVTSAGISAAIVFGFMAALVFKPRG